MKLNRLGWLLGLAVMLTGSRVMAAGEFEGELDMKMSSGNAEKSMVMQYFVKGHKMRSQASSEDGKFSGGAIIDFQTHQMIMVMDKQKMYMVSKLNSEAFTPKKDNHFKITKTGNTQTILGYSCREWDYTSDDNSGKMWFASGIGNWWANSMAAQSKNLTSDQKAMVNLVLSEKLFPMKWESTGKDGNVRGSSEVVKIEKKSLDSSLFSPPAGYKKFNMPDFGGMGDGSGKKPSKEDLMKMMEQFKK